jgi:hypothetical protein
MSVATYFTHECPVCGRHLQVRIEYLGARIACPHCRGDFVVTTARQHQPAPVYSGESLVARADHLLESANHHVHR